MPLRRKVNGAVESYHTSAFLLESGRSVGEAIGLWAEVDGQLGRLIRREPPDLEESPQVVGMNVQRAFDRNVAQQQNGTTEQGDGPRVTCIGAGALGSQVLMNLTRAGWGSWTVVDHDQLLPHNLARHALFGSQVGEHKAKGLELLGSLTIEGEQAISAIVADVLEPLDTAEGLSDSLARAELIVDMAASVPVARRLSCDVDSSARRISLFLNPRGTDLVLLAEDRDRVTPLDVLEMQYYRAISSDSSLSDHLADSDTRRYGLGCRDVSSVLPQDQVAIHSGLGAHALRTAWDQSKSTIAIWRLDPSSFSIAQTEIQSEAMIEFRLADWTLRTDDGVVRKLEHWRSARLPSETGGVLVGSVDRTRRIVYVADALPSPRDSIEWPHSYIRGTRGLSQKVAAISALTHEQLNYVGEWHSHPDGSSTLPSEDDREAFRWLADRISLDSQPAVFCIVGGDDSTSWHVDEMR